MLERQRTEAPELAPPGATPTLDRLPRSLADFETIGEALDYAAKGQRGLNFHDARGTLARAYPYSELRADALVQARRLVALGIGPGDRVALIAETGPEFAACFFGAVYAGAWPVPLPLPTSFGGRDAYVDQLAVQLESCDPALFLYPAELADFCRERRRAGPASPARDWESLDEIDPATAELPLCQGRRHRLSPIFERLDPLPARRRGHPSRFARQSSRPRRSASGRGSRPLHLLAALVP